LMLTLYKCNYCYEHWSQRPSLDFHIYLNTIKRKLKEI